MTAVPPVRRRGIAALTLALAMSVPVPRAMAGEPPLSVEAAAPGVYVHHGAHADADPENHGDIANVGFVVGRDAVAVIDTGGSAVVGRRLRAAVRQTTDRPIRYVVNTHMHPDHVLGNAAFTADAPVFVGHAALPSALSRRAAFYLDTLRRTVGDDAADGGVVLPTRTVADREEIDLGDRRLTLQAYPTAHTDNDLTVFDQTTRTLWAGDLVFIDRIPAVDGSATGWLSVLDRLAAVPAQRVVPGHGPVSAAWPDALADERRYLTTLVDGVRAILRHGGTMEQAMDTVAGSERGAWLLFDDYNRRNVAATFAALEWE